MCSLKNVRWLFCFIVIVFQLNTYAEKKTEKNEKTNEDESVQAALESLKKEVLSINRELFILEEDLLFPASTQTAFFLSVNLGYFFKLDSIKLKVDGKVITQYLYTDREADALRRGGIQRLHVDNMKSGEHELVAVVIGYGPQKREYKLAVKSKFKKTTEALRLEVKIHDDPKKQQPKLSIKEWE